MSASHFPVMRVAAMQATAALARYERHVRMLASTWLDMDRYAQVSEEIDDIKLVCTTLPGVELPWAALLVSHAELIHALWEDSQGSAASAHEDAQRRLDEHLACIDTLARSCQRIADIGTGGDRRA